MHKKERALLPSLMNEIEDFRNFFDIGFDNFFAPTKFENSSLSVYEDENHVYVEAAMPGLNRDEIEISFEKNILWIKGESKKEEKDVKYHMKASSCFSYRLPIPSKIDENETPKASYKNGILKVTFNKSHKEKPKKINISIED